jgi:PDZ domain-containing secreted protein
MDDLNNTLEKLQTLMVSDVDNNDVNDSDAEYEAKDDMDFNESANESEYDDIEVDDVTTTLTENGDLAYTNVNSPLVDILFKS